MTIRRQVEALITATGVATVIVLTQVNTASVLVFTFIVIYILACNMQHCITLYSVIWSETVDLRTRPVSDQKIGLGLGLSLAGLVLRCETRFCHAHHHNELEGHSNFSSIIHSFSILCLDHHCCGDQQWWTGVRLFKS